MVLAKSSVDAEILFDEREVITGPDGPIWRDVEKVPSGFRFALREIDDNVEPGEEKVLKRQIGQGVGSIELAKERALRTKPPKVKKSSRSGAPELKLKAPRHQQIRRQRKAQAEEIDRAFSQMLPNGVKAADVREAAKFVDDVLIPFVKKVAQ